MSKNVILVYLIFKYIIQLKYNILLIIIVYQNNKIDLKMHN